MRKRTNHLKLLPDKEPLISVGVDIIGLLSKGKSGRICILVITDRFTKITQAIPLHKLDAYTVARAFDDELFLKYGSEEKVLSENGSQTSSRGFRRVCQVMDIAN